MGKEKILRSVTKREVAFGYFAFTGRNLFELLFVE